MKKLLGILVLGLLLSTNAYAKCKQEDYVNYVSSKKGCIGIEPVGQKIDGSFVKPNRKNLLIYLHGYGGGGQDDRKLIYTIRNNNTNAFFMAMPGYITPGWKNKSSGSQKQQYVLKGFGPIANAIKNLKDHYKPEKTILVGYSNGAGRTAIIIAKYPGLIDEALLIACPCNLGKWHIKLHGGSKNISPHTLVKKIDKKTKVKIVVGRHDKETPPNLSDDYYERLQKNNIQSELLLVDAPHHRSVLHVNKELIAFAKEILN